MKLNQLIAELQVIQKVHGDIYVTLDDLYTPASLYVDNIFVEPRDGILNKEKVVVIRA